MWSIVHFVSSPHLMIENVSHNTVPGPGFYTFQLLKTSLNCRFSYQHHPCYYLFPTFLHIEPSPLKTNMARLKITQLETNIVSQTSILGSQRYCAITFLFGSRYSTKKHSSLSIDLCLMGVAGSFGESFSPWGGNRSRGKSMVNSRPKSVGTSVFFGFRLPNVNYHPWN